MDKPCNTCGGIGNGELIVTCSWCRGREHVYCMRNILHEVPDEENWLCQTCSSKSDAKAPNSGKQASGKVKYITPEEAISLSSRAIKSRTYLSLRPGPVNATTCISMRTPMSSRTATSNISSGKVKENPSFKPSGHLGHSIDGKVQLNAINNKPASDALKEVKGATKPTSGISGKHIEGLKRLDRTPVLPKLRANSAMDQIGTPTKALKICNPETEKAANKALCASSTLMDHLPNISSEKKDLVNCMKENICKEQPINVLISAKENEALDTTIEKMVNMESDKSLADSRHLSLIISLGGNLQAVTAPKNSDEKRDLLNILPEFKQFLPYFPAPEVIWKGGFEVLDGEVCGEFWAHSSAKAHRKAYEFAKKMPSILEVKLLPRSHIWADLFQDTCPDPRDIALYFLPSNLESSKGNYSWLFKLMEIRDVVMKSCIDGVELLVITSKQLLVGSQSSGNGYFLWGVFRRAKNDQPVNMEHDSLSVLPSEGVCDDTNMDNTANTDMEIDMAGRQNMGIVDIVVSKDSLRNESSKRDETIHQTPEAKTLTELRPMESSTKQQSVKFKRDQPNSSISYPGLTQKVKCDSTKKIALSRAMQEMVVPPGFNEISRVKQQSASCRGPFRDEKPLLFYGRFTSSVQKKNIGLEGVSVEGFGVQSIQRQRIAEDADSPRTLKRHLKPPNDLAKSPLAANFPPLSKKRTKSGLEIKAENSDGEKLVEMGGKINSSHGYRKPYCAVVKAERNDGETHGKTEGKSSNGFLQSVPVEVKDEVKKHKVDTQDVVTHKVRTPRTSNCTMQIQSPKAPLHQY